MSWLKANVSHGTILLVSLFNPPIDGQVFPETQGVKYWKKVSWPGSVGGTGIIRPVWPPLLKEPPLQLIEGSERDTHTGKVRQQLVLASQMRCVGSNSGVLRQHLLSPEQE